jgi:hypothetical protein
MVIAGRNSNKSNSQRRKRRNTTRKTKKREIENRRRLENQRKRKTAGEEETTGEEENETEGRRRKKLPAPIKDKVVRRADRILFTPPPPLSCYIVKKKFGFEGDGSDLKVVERGQKKRFLDRESKVFFTL